MVKILIKKLSEKAIIPKYETPDSSGMDLSALIDKNFYIEPGGRTVIPTGLSVTIPKGYEIQIRQDQGLLQKKG